MRGRCRDCGLGATWIVDDTHTAGGRWRGDLDVDPCPVGGDDFHHYDPLPDPITPRPIEWRTRTGPGTAGAPDGYVDGARLFSVSYGLVRRREAPWHLTTFLPGMKGYRDPIECESIEAAQARAARILAAFIDRLIEPRG